MHRPMSKLPAGARISASVRTHLLALCLALVLPLLAFSAVAVSDFTGSERAASHERALALSAALANTVDRDLAAKISLLETLAVSTVLREHKLEQFYREAYEALERTGAHVLLADVQGQLLLHTRVPFGTKLPSSWEPDDLRAVSITKAPRITELFRGEISQRYVYNIEIPVIEQGDVKFVLALAPEVERLSRSLQEQPIPAGWAAVIWDNNGAIIGRSANVETYLGQSVPTDIVKQVNGNHGLFFATDQGERSLFAFTRSSLASWPVVVHVPVDVLEAPLRTSWIQLLWLWTAAAVLALLLAFLFARRISGAVREAARVAQSGNLSPRATSARTGVVEADEVIAVLGKTAAQLNAHSAHLEFTMRELLHRTKNLLFVIQSMAHQSARQAASTADFEKSFSGRLQSLSRCHDLLVERNWEGARIGDIVRVQTAPFSDGRSDAFSITGPDLFVSPKASESLSLAFHELCTNALKHGALAVPGGRIRITWRIADTPPAFHLEWVETARRDGPVGERRGFGFSVLTKVAPASLKGVARLSFSDAGLTYELDAPMVGLLPTA